MIRFSEVPMPVRDAYYAVLALIILLTLFSFVINLAWRSRKIVSAVNAALLAAEYLYLSCLHEAYAVTLFAPEQEISAIGQAFYDMPLWLAWTAAAAFLLLTAVGLWHSYRWHRCHIGKLSIKKGMDKLPVGLCFYDEKGMPLLTNHAMDEICADLTGQTVLDGKLLWQTVTDGVARPGVAYVKAGEAPIVKLPDGRIKSFIRRQIHPSLTELIAADVTTQYELGEELKKENEDLRRMNARLVDYGEHIVTITRERELLTAKIHIHDEMGRLLLLLKRCLRPEASAEERAYLLSEWRKLARLLANETGPVNVREEMRSYAKALGIRLILRGDIPEEPRVAEVMLVAVKECLTNTCAHAGGDELTAMVEETEQTYQIRCTNNGIIPRTPIREGGGLSSLRRLTERAGGTMQIAISPQYMLSITLPKEEVWTRSML